MEEVDEFESEPFAAALTHPLSGADHWLAALAIGFVVWSRGRKTGFQSVVGFTLTLAAGIAAGRAGMQLPMVEAGLALTVVLAGLTVAAARRFPSWTVLLVSALTGAWHGLAHGMEMPAAAPPGLSALGLTLGSGALALLAGGLASLIRPGNPSLSRWTGTGIAAAGLWLLVS